MNENFREASDLLEAAIRIERAGIELYQKLYEAASDSNLRDLFNFLSAEEEKHAGVFRKLLEGVADYIPRYKYPGEYEQYLEGIAYRMIGASKKAAEFIEAKNNVEAIGMAVELEKMSVEFYSEAKKYFSGAGLNCVQGIIDEEKGHQAKLEALKGNLKF